MSATEEDGDSDRVYDVVLGLRGRDVGVADHGYVLATPRVCCHGHLATTMTTTTTTAAAVSWAGTSELRVRTGVCSLRSLGCHVTSKNQSRK